MIDEIKLAELRKRLTGPADMEKVAIQCASWWQMADTLAKLWKGMRAAQTMNEIADFGDRIYDVRERELQGWEGPKVVAYGKAHNDFRDALAALDDGKDA